MTRRRSLLTVLMAVAVAVTGALAGCGGDDEPEERAQPTTTAPPTTEATTTEPTTTEPSDEAQLRQLAEDWWEAIRQAYLSGDRTDLDHYVTGEYLDDVNAQIDRFEASANGVEFADESRHEVLEVAIEERSAVLTECVIDADVLLGVDGEVLNDEVQANLYETEAVKLAGGWRLSRRTVLSEVDGSDECPAA